MRIGPQDVNKLRAMMEAGIPVEEMLSGQTIQGGDNALAQFIEPMVPNEQTFAAFAQQAPQPGQGFMTGSNGSRMTFGAQTADAPMAPRGIPGGRSDIDYSRPMIQTPQGKGYYSKDGMRAILPNGTEVLLGYDSEKSDRLNARELDRQAKMAQIAATQESTAASLAARTRKESNELVPGGGTAQAVLEKQYGKAPDGTRWTVDGRLEELKMPDGTVGKLTESQGKAMNFGSRMANSHEILNYIGEDGKVQPGLIKRFAESVPLVGGALGMAANLTQSTPQQQIEQAQRDFVNATLRRESGAVISPSEFANATVQYFPQPGDAPEVIRQKKQNREIAIASLAEESGPGKRRVIKSGADARARFEVQAQARDAIKKGAPREAVNQRLQSMGYDPV